MFWTHSELVKHVFGFCITDTVHTTELASKCIHEYWDRSSFLKSSRVSSGKLLLEWMIVREPLLWLIMTTDVGASQES
jgi:hypothetical protein